VAQDGKICEAVVWECGPGERHLIVDESASYALGRHLGPGTNVEAFCGALDAALVEEGSDANAGVQAGRWAATAAAARLAVGHAALHSSWSLGVRFRWRERMLGEQAQVAGPTRAASEN
jgi:Nrap protein domain 3